MEGIVFKEGVINKARFFVNLIDDNRAFKAAGMIVDYTKDWWPWERRAFTKLIREIRSEKESLPFIEPEDDEQSVINNVK